jgi:hypothetical protein
MRNHMAVTIEGWKDSVKGKGRLHAVGFEYNKLNTNIELLSFYGQYFISETPISITKCLEIGKFNNPAKRRI